MDEGATLGIAPMPRWGVEIPTPAAVFLECWTARSATSLLLDSQEKERRVWLYQLVQSQLCSRHSEDDEEQKHREFAGGKSGELRAGLQAVLDPRRRGGGGETGAF